MRHIAVFFLLIFVFVLVATPAFAIDDTIQDFDEMFGEGGRENFIQEMSTYGGQIIDLIQALAIIVLTVALVWNGFVLISQGSNEQQIAAAKQKVIPVGIGLLIVFFYAEIATFIGSLFGW